MASSVRPITPDEVGQVRSDSLLPQVIEVFNDLITEKWNGHKAIIKQEEAVQRVVEKLDVSRSWIFECGLLDVEDAYRKVGWTVQFDKPGFNETYEPFFVFTRGGT